MIPYFERSTALVVAGTQLYRYNPDERDGTIQIDQFDILSGRKIITLDTFVPWMAVDDEGDRIHRMISKAHVVGNRLVLLITSVGSHINHIVTFSLSP